MSDRPTSLAEWWVEDGINHLKGIPGSAFDPPIDPPIIDECTGQILNIHHGAVLSDEFIICFLRMVPAARDSFCRMIRYCSLEEQERLQALIDGPGRFLKPDPKANDAALMRNQNRLPPISYGPGPLAPGDPRRNGRS